MVNVVRECIIRCPVCGVEKLEEMPVNACVRLYVCTGCGAELRPKPGDCCVYCSYGSIRCPPMQGSRVEK